MLLSIITVCKNEEKRVGKTIRSILAQKDAFFEYIVMDGGSSDNTVSILESYKDEFTEKGIDYRIVSQNDTGIYNAMNNAIECAKGDWVLFLNAGDRLYTKRLFDIVKNNASLCDVIYGDVLLIENGYWKKKKADDYHNLPVEMPMCHQSVVCKTEILKEYGFREEYRLAADYDFLLRAFKEGKRFKYIYNIISVFPLDGQSTRSAWKYQTEMMRSGRSVCGFNICYQSKALFNSLVRMGKIWGARIFSNLYHNENRGWKRIR